MVKVQLPAAASGLKPLQHKAHTAILAILDILEQRFCFVLWSTHKLRPFLSSLSGAGKAGLKMQTCAASA